MSLCKKAASRGIPIVIVGSPFPFAASDNVFYVLNDEEKEAGSPREESVSVCMAKAL